MRRSEAAMVLDILESLINNGGAMNMTRLSQEANLSYQKLLAIVSKLASNSIVEVVDHGGRKEVMITPKGRVLLRELRRLRRLLDDLDIKF